MAIHRPSREEIKNGQRNQQLYEIFQKISLTPRVLATLKKKLDWKAVKKNMIYLPTR